MNWADFFYPENPKMRETLIRRSQEIVELMKNNFRATNQLIYVLQKHWGLYFSPITLNEKDTVKANCDVFIQRIREIQAQLAKIDKELSKKLEPDLYEKLKKKHLSIPERANVSGVLRAIQDGVSGIMTPLLVGGLLRILQTLSALIGKCNAIANGVFGCFIFDMLSLGIDATVQLILGSTERDQLKQALKEHEDALKDFRPASEKYQDNINEVRITIILKGDRE